MANVKISELTAITSASDLADADVVPIVDNSDTTTKKVALSVLEGFFHDSSRDFPCGITVGVDGTGADATFNAVTTGCKLLWDASDGSNAGGLCLTDNTRLTFGTGGDADFYYDGSDLKLNPQVAGSGDFDITAGGLSIASTEKLYFDGGVHTFICEDSGGTLIFNVNALVATYITDAGITSVNCGLAVGLAGAGADATFNAVTSGCKMVWDASDNSNKGSLSLTDNALLTFGTGGDADMYYDGSDLKLNPQVAGSGDFDITAGGLSIASTEKLYFDGGVHTFICETSGGTLVFDIAGASVMCMNDGGGMVVNSCFKVGIPGTGADASFNAVKNNCRAHWDASYQSDVGGFVFTDNARLVFGSGCDTEMYYDGTDMYINPTVVGTGSFIVGGASSCFLVSGVNAKVGIGTSAPGAELHITDTGNPSLWLHRVDSSIDSGQAIGDLEWIGAEDGAADIVGRIRIVATEDWATDDSPTDMTFSTTPDGAVLATEKMRITSSGKVGIGTTQDGCAILQTGAGSNSTNACVVFNVKASEVGLDVTSGSVHVGTWALADAGRHGTQSNHCMTLASNDTVAMTIDTSQNVGIGTAPAAWHSSYDGVLQVANSSVSDNAGTQLDVGINFYYDGAYKKLFEGLSSRYTQSAGVHKWDTAATHATTVTFSEVMRIDADGNVGVGTTDPDGLLHIYNSSAGVTASSNADELIIESSAHAGLSILSGNTSRGSIYFGDSGSNAYASINYCHNNDEMNFATAGSARAFIGSSGCVGIGTNSGVATLDVAGNSASGRVFVFSRAGGGAGSRTFGAYIGGTADCTLVFTASDDNTAAAAFCCPILALEAGTAYVGIGTNAPSNLFHIEDNSSNAVMFIDQNGAGDLLVLKCGASERFRFEATGDFGIGTVTPSQRLAVYDATGGSEFVAKFVDTDDVQVLSLEGNTDDENGPQMELYHRSQTPAANDQVGRITFRGSDVSANKTDFAQVMGCAVAITGGAETGSLSFQTAATGGSLATGLYQDQFQNVAVGSITALATQSSWVALKLGHNNVISAQCNLTAGANFYITQNAYRYSDGSTHCWAHISEDEASAIALNDGHLTFFTAVSAAAAATAALTQKMKVSNDGCVCVNCGLDVGGALSKGSGTFKIDHPLESKKDTHYLSHSFIEGPQADLMYRGIVQLVDGSAEINVDTVSGMTEGTFVSLNRCTQVFTTNESNWDAVKGNVTGNTLTIESNTEASTACISWMVVGERCDPHIMDTTITDDDGRVIVEYEK